MSNDWFCGRCYKALYGENPCGEHTIGEYSLCKDCCKMCNDDGSMTVEEFIALLTPEEKQELDDKWFELMMLGSCELTLDRIRVEGARVQKFRTVPE